MAQVIFPTIHQGRDATHKRFDWDDCRKEVTAFHSPSSTRFHGFNAKTGFDRVLLVLDMGNGISCTNTIFHHHN
jgi:hypothetical protein